jgi:hypothetical protein
LRYDASNQFVERISSSKASKGVIDSCRIFVMGMRLFPDGFAGLGRLTRRRLERTLGQTLATLWKRRIFLAGM